MLGYALTIVIAGAVSFWAGWSLRLLSAIEWRGRVDLAVEATRRHGVVVTMVLRRPRSTYRTYANFCPAEARDFAKQFASAAEKVERWHEGKVVTIARRR